MKFFLVILFFLFKGDLSFAQNNIENTVSISNNEIKFNVTSNKTNINKNDSLIISLNSIGINDSILFYFYIKGYEFLDNSSYVLDCGYLMYDNFTNQLIKLRKPSEIPIEHILKFSYDMLKSNLPGDFIELTIAIGYIHLKDLRKIKYEKDSENICYLFFNDYLLNYKKLPIVNIRYEIK